MAVTVNAAIIDEKDTVVVAIEKINAGDEIIWRDRNGDVQKIGEHIGLAACDIHVGEHVHVHNVQNHRENL